MVAIVECYAGFASHNPAKSRQRSAISDQQAEARSAQVPPGLVAVLSSFDRIRSEYWVPVMTESIMSLSQFKADASRLLRRMQDEPGVLVLTQNGRARAVVQDFGQYQAEQQGLLMLKLLVQGEADVSAGRVAPQGEVVADLRRRLGPPTCCRPWREAPVSGH
jgi:hypothetical protein